MPLPETCVNCGKPLVLKENFFGRKKCLTRGCGYYKAETKGFTYQQAFQAKKKRWHLLYVFHETIQATIFFRCYGPGFGSPVEFKGAFVSAKRFRKMLAFL